MERSNPAIQIICAPSILGLKPSGVELLPESLLNSGLNKLIDSKNPIIELPAPNHLYSNRRDPETNCLNPLLIRDYSIELGKAIDTINKDQFALVLGGDCSILIGIMQALKGNGKFGLIFLDAHADFYEPEKSITGEVADMDLAIVTGRGPEVLTNINNRKPYVDDELVIHIGQRDWEETKKYRSQDIRETKIKCFSLEEIRTGGINNTVKAILTHIKRMDTDGFWIHFDTDVLSDDINPAVDYRLPGGLELEEVKEVLKSIIQTGMIFGLSVSIFNPELDIDGHSSKSIAHLIVQSLA